MRAGQVYHRHGGERDCPLAVVDINIHGFVPPVAELFFAATKISPFANGPEIGIASSALPLRPFKVI